MILTVQGTRSFDDYSVFLRAMGTAMSMMENDKEFLIFSAGPVNINEMALTFTNISERSLKARGIKIRFNRIPASWIEQNMDKIDYFAYFSKPKENISKQVKMADAKDVEVGVYRY